MANETMRANESDAPREKKLDDLYELIDGIEIAMMTTRRPDGHLVSRAMATQGRTAGADLWFVTDAEAHKLDELEHDPHVNLAYYRDRTREWVSVSGTATLSRDRGRIRELYRDDWKIWFPDEGGARNGGPDDPRIVLIRVDAHSVVYTKKDRPAPMVLFELVKARTTGSAPDIADVRRLDERELEGGSGRM